MEAVLDWLVAERLCLPVKAEGVRAFPGSCRFTDLRILLHAERRVSQFKIVLHGADRRAKAYMDMRAIAHAAG